MSQSIFTRPASCAERSSHAACITRCSPALTRSPGSRLCRSGCPPGQYEPSILERSVAITDLILGKEIAWLARLYNSIFWILGGVAVFDLARRMAKYALKEPSEAASDWIVYASALVPLGYYLVLPFSVQASRAFQPDPGMTVWIILAAYTAFRWSDVASRKSDVASRKSDIASGKSDPGAWKWALFTGICSGMAVLTKAVAFYPIAGILILMTHPHLPGAVPG